MNRLLSALVLSAVFAGSQVFAQVCTGLCLQQITCAGSATTTVSGIVYAPNGTDPLPNVLVYVPNAPVAPFTSGVSCDVAGSPASGSPLVSAFTAINGTFTLTNVPVGTNIPLVIQTGRWRRQVTIPVVSACTNTILPATATHLPQNQSQGDIPKIAIVTGDVDSLECVLRKIGISDSEFTNPALQGGNGRINFYLGAGDPGATINSNTPSETALWGGSSPTINEYDMVMFPCQGVVSVKTLADQNTVAGYANAGGRIFATHYSYVWLDPGPFAGTANWALNQVTPADQTGTINQTFAKGAQLATWLQDVVHGSTTLGQIPLNTLRDDENGVIAPTQSWLTIGTSPEAMQMTFNTPIASPAQNQCGRILFNEYHVEAAGILAGTAFPNECPALGTALTPQERLLEFSIFDLSTFVSPDVPPTLSVSVTNSPAAFTQGDTSTGATQDIIDINVTNTSTTDPTNPSLIVTASLPAGLTAFQMFGTNSNTGWNCAAATLTCNRTGGLSANTSDPITLTVNVSPTAPVGPQPVSATASGGGLAVAVTGRENITIQGLPVITWAPASLTYGTPLGAAQLDASANVAGTFAYTPGTGTMLGAGPQTLSVTFTPSVPNYVSVTTTTTLQVGQATPAVTFTGAPASAPYLSTFNVATTTTDTGNTPAIMASGSCSIAGTTVTMTSGTGTCNLTATWTADANYAGATATQSTIASKIAPTVSFTGAPATAGYQAAFTVVSTTSASTTASITSGGACSNTGNAVTMTSGTGTCSLTATWAADSNYNGATLTQSTTATTIAPTVTFTGAPSGAVYQTSFTVASTTNASTTALITSGGVCSNIGNAVTMTSGTGTCSLTATWAADNNYSSATLTQSTTASKIAPTVTFTGAPVSAAYQSGFTVASTTNATTTASITSGGACSNTGNAVTMTSGNGTCSLTATWAADNNYSSSTLTQSTTASKIAPAVTFTGAPNSAAYQSGFTVASTTNASTTASVTSAGACSNIGNAVTMTSGTGTCSMTATWAADNNYSLATLTQNTGASKIAPIVSFTGAPFNAAFNATFTVVATTSDTGNPVSITAGGACSIAGTTVTMTSGAGTCNLLATWATDNNYLSATLTQTTMAGKLAPVLTWTMPGAIMYGTQLSPIQLDASANVAGTFAYNHPVGTVLGAGVNQPLSATFTPTNPNYAIATAATSITVTPATLTVTAASFGQVFGTAVPPLTYTIGGFVNNDPSSVVSGMPALATTASASSLPGAYPITIGLGSLSAANYTFNLIGGALTVTYTGLAPSSGSLCNGAYDGTFNGNLNVTAGEVCIFDNGAVTGNVTQTGGTFELIHSTTGGDVQVNGGGTFMISAGSYIGGNLQVQHLPASSVADTVCGSTVHNDLQFQNNAAPVLIGAATGCPGNTVSGNLTIQGNSATASAVGNNVGNNLTVQNNTAATTVDSNTVKGNLQDQSNTASTEVFTNVVTGTLQCQQDSSITGGGNTAQSKQGQCSAD